MGLGGSGDGAVAAVGSELFLCSCCSHSTVRAVLRAEVLQKFGFAGVVGNMGEVGGRSVTITNLPAFFEIWQRNVKVITRSIARG